MKAWALALIALSDLSGAQQKHPIQVHVADTTGALVPGADILVHPVPVDDLAPLTPEQRLKTDPYGTLKLSLP